MARHEVKDYGGEGGLDQVRATARPKLQQAIDRIWQRILDEGR